MNSSGQSDTQNNSTRDPMDEQQQNLHVSLVLDDEDAGATTTRLIERNLPYHQSRQKLNIKNWYGETHKCYHWWQLFGEDWFHVMLRWPTPLTLFLLLSVWTIMILIFAGFYIAVDRKDPDVNCGLGEVGSPIRFGGGFAFSLETCTTVGYGLPGSTNAYFENCPALQVVIYFQMVWSMLFNAFLLSFVFARFARCEARAIQLLFGNKAIIAWDAREKRWLFQIRVYDADSAYPVVEAHIRLYVIRPGKELQPMRLLDPNDDLGGVLFTSIPTTVSHHIDAYSPLSPLEKNDTRGILDGAGLILREVDSQTANRDGHPCPVCGEVYGTHDRLLKHIAYNRVIEGADENVPIEGSHQEKEALQHIEDPRVLEAEELRQYLKNLEILCVVEGIDPLVSGTFQGIQSYMVNDIVFGGTFAPCVFYRKEKMVVDLDMFHAILDDAENKKDK